MTTNDHKKGEQANPKPKNENPTKNENSFEIGRIGKRYKNPKYSEAPPSHIGIDRGRWED